MGEPEQVVDGLDEASISREWEELAGGGLDSSDDAPTVVTSARDAAKAMRPVAPAVKADKESSLSDLFANLAVKPKRRAASIVPAGDRARGMAVALTLVKGGAAERSPIPAPPSRRDLAALAPRSVVPGLPGRSAPPPPSRVAPPAPSARSFPPPPSRSAPPVAGATASVSPPRDVPVARASVAPPPPSLRTQRASDAPPREESGERALGDAERAAPPPVMTAPPPVATTPMPPAAQAAAAVVVEAPKPKEEQVVPVDSWNEETPTTLWKGGRHGLPARIAERAARAAAARAESSPPGGARAVDLPALPPPPALPREHVPTDPAVRAAVQSIAPLAYSQPPPPPSTSRDLRIALIAIAATLAAAVLGLFVFVAQRTSGLASSGEGALVVTVASGDGTAVPTFDLFVDGTRRCETSPCRVESLGEGSHFVKVTAKGFLPTADRAVAVKPGSDSVLHLALVPEAKPEVPSGPAPVAAASLPAEGASGEAAGARADVAPSRSFAAPRSGGAAPAAPVKVAPAPVRQQPGTLVITSFPPSNVVVDGRPLGTTPQSVKLAPGVHTVVFAGPKGRKVQSVSLESGKTRSVSVRF